MYESAIFNVVFEYNGTKLIGNFKGNDKMANICKWFINKTNMNMSNLIFMYNGESVNFNLSINEQISATDRRNLKMFVIVLLLFL